MFNAPETFDALTLVSGGAASVNTSSLTVVTQPPAGDGTVVASTSAGHGLLTLLPGDSATSTFSATFAYCAPGDTYSPGSPNCTTATMAYAPATDQLMGEAVTVSGISEDIYEDTEIAAVQPATAQQGAPVTVTLAAVGSSVPSLQSTPIGNATVNYADDFTTVFPAPAGLTLVPGSFKVTGGDTVTEGVATAEYCTAAGTGCDAQINTGNYKTTYPYIETRASGRRSCQRRSELHPPHGLGAVHGDRRRRDRRQRDAVGVPAQHQRESSRSSARRTRTSTATPRRVTPVRLPTRRPVALGSTNDRPAADALRPSPRRRARPSRPGAREASR